LDFLSTRLPQFYEQRLLDVVNGRFERVMQSRFWSQPSKIEPASIIRLNENEFEVHQIISKTLQCRVPFLLGAQ
jgi:hypothetical protein